MSFKRYPAYKDSGVEWLGQVPAHWKLVPLARMTIARCDGPFGSGLKSDHYVESGARVVRLQNITRQGFDGTDSAYIDIEYFMSELRRHEVLPGDVLVAGLGDERNTVGRACVAPSELGAAMVKADCFRFRLDRSIANPDFVALQLSAGADFDAGMLATGSTRSRIPLSEMGQRRIALPSLGEQEALARFALSESDKIDQLATEQSRLIELLREKRQAVISHAVTKGLDPDVPMKPSGVDWLGEIPATWEVVGFTKYLSSVVDYRGRTPTKTDTGVLLVTARNIRDGVIDYEASAEFIEATEYDTVMSRGKPELGDVLFTTEAPMGQVANVDRTDIALAQRVIKFRGTNSVLENAYLKYWIMGEFCQADINRLATGSTALGIKGSKIGQLRLCLPPVEEQRAIVEHIERETSRIDTLITEAERAIALLEERRSALITAAVTGQIDVRP